MDSRHTSRAPRGWPRSSRDRLRLTLCVLAVLYAVGAWGMLGPYRAGFLELSFTNLIVTAALLLWNAQGFDRGGGLSFLIAAVAGFAIEYVGVSTGWPFGVYSYTEHLGPRWLGVPLVIGLNWAILTHATQATLAHALDRCSKPLNPWLGAVLGATLMTAFDWLLEPAAIALRFWVWEDAVVPLANYLAWWVISFVLLSVSQRLNPRLRNPAGVWVLGVQALFFVLVSRPV